MQGGVVGLHDTQFIDIDDEYSEAEDEQQRRGAVDVPWTTSRHRGRHQLTASATATLILHRRFQCRGVQTPDARYVISPQRQTASRSTHG